MTDTFAFGELSASAKEKALEAHREKLEYCWYDTVYEDAARIGGLLGIGIEQGTSRTVRGESALQLKISFSGFSSQGDGCCWSGALWVTDFENAVAKIAEEAPKDADLAALAEQAQKIWEQITAVYVAQRLDDGPTTVDDPALTGYADCYPTVQYGVKGEDRHGYSSTIHGHYDIPIEVDKALDSFCQGFADWIYEQLEQDHDHLTSDETTQVYIEEHGLRFYEDGSDV